MSARLKAIQQHRAALVARAAVQRQDVGEIFAAWSGPIALVDRGVALYRRAQPLFLAGGAALFFWLVRHRKGMWMARALTVLKLLTSFARMRASRH